MIQHATICLRSDAPDEYRLGQRIAALVGDGDTHRGGIHTSQEIEVTIYKIERVDDHYLAWANLRGHA